MGKLSYGRAMSALAIATAFVLGSQTARAEVVLDRAMVVSYAKSKSPDVKVAGAEAMQAKSGVVGMGLVSLDNPSISAVGGTKIGSKSPELAAQINVPIDLGGRPGARKEAAEARAEVAVAQSADATRLAVREALLRYVRALRAKVEIDLAKSRVDIAKTLLGVASRRLAAGDISEGEVALVELEQVREVSRAQTAHGAFAASKSLLAAYVGAPADAAVTGEMVPADELPGLDSLLDALGKRPDVVAAIRDVSAAQSSYSLAKADAWPTLVLIGGWEYHEQTSFYRAGFLLPLPLFNPNKTQVSIGGARIDTAKSQLAAARARAEGEVRAAHARFLAARSALEPLKKTGELAESAISRATKAYDLGKVPLSDVLFARRTVAEAIKERYDAELALAEARIDVDAAAGRLP
jgi:cobalt-zinc-cadmium efflux system outer membrane protein